MNKTKNSNRQIKLGALMSYFTIGFNIISGLIYTPWMIRQIGQSDYGLYTLAVSIISFFAMDFGLGSAVSRFLSKYNANNDLQGRKRFLGIIFKLFTYISLLIFIVLIIVYFMIENIYLKLDPIEIQKLKVIFVISGLFTVISFPFKPFNGILIANERFVFIRSVELINKLVTVLLLVASLTLGYGLYSIVFVNALVGVFSIALKYLYIKKDTDTELELEHKDKKLYSEIFKFSFWTTINSVAQRFVLNITPSILGVFASSAEISIFSVGMTIEGYTWAISHAFGDLFLPKVTKITIGENSAQKMENLLIRIGRIQLIIIGLLIVGFISMGKEFMCLWMGTNFKKSYYVALLLILPGIIAMTQEIANTALIALNKIMHSAIASLIVSTTSIVLSLILSPTLGAIGSAIAVFLGTIFGSVIYMNIIYFKVLKINVYHFFKECHLKMIFPIILTLVVSIIIQKNIISTSWFFFIIKAMFVCLIYFILIWILALNSFEKNEILRLVKR